MSMLDYTYLANRDGSELFCGLVDGLVKQRFCD